jgi:hypothetical protein
MDDAELRRVVRVLDAKTGDELNAAWQDNDE